MEIYGEVSFHLKPDSVDALKAKAREVDEEEVDGEYTVAQALQVVWHLEPAWLHTHILDGWTLDKATDENGEMREVWP